MRVNQRVTLIETSFVTDNWPSFAVARSTYEPGSEKRAVVNA